MEKRYVRHILKVESNVQTGWGEYEASLLCTLVTGSINIVPFLCSFRESAAIVHKWHPFGDCTSLTTQTLDLSGKRSCIQHFRIRSGGCIRMKEALVFLQSPLPQTTVEVIWLTIQTNRSFILESVELEQGSRYLFIGLFINVAFTATYSQTEWNVHNQFLSCPVISFVQTTLPFFTPSSSTPASNL